MTVTNPNDPWYYCPAHMLDSFRDYVNKGIKPSGFALALLENNFMEVMMTAANTNTSVLNNFVMFLKSALPKGSNGSREIVNAWVASKADKSIPVGMVKAVAEIIDDQQSTGRDITKNKLPKRPGVQKKQRGRPKRNAVPDNAASQVEGDAMAGTTQESTGGS